ncbi:hypothetical protein OIU79_023402 [Salix purpurea]|uniref:Uncharacterized protein n=1 Tax=Salix purpurea TaxID=77065 RepID=A0A9Q0WBM6_SALPP|nr:hypothetical protein OIU79_023402 [Salix purpurea]
MKSWCKASHIAKLWKQRFLSVSSKVYVGRIREDDRGWTENSYVSLRRVIYEPLTSSPAPSRWFLTSPRPVCSSL